MKFKDLENNVFTISLGQYISIDQNRPRSKLHLTARQLIRKAYPTLMLTEEVPIKIKRGKTLYLDFFLPLINTVIEVHGEQHYKYSTMFHSSAQDFMLQKKNDNSKAEWCEYNNLQLIVLPFSEDEEQWLKRILTTDLN